MDIILQNITKNITHILFTAIRAFDASDSKFLTFDKLLEAIKCVFDCTSSERASVLSSLRRSGMVDWDVGFGTTVDRYLESLDEWEGRLDLEMDIAVMIVVSGDVGQCLLYIKQLLALRERYSKIPEVTKGIICIHKYQKHVRQLEKKAAAAAGVAFEQVAREREEAVAETPEAAEAEALKRFIIKKKLTPEVHVRRKAEFPESVVLPKPISKAEAAAAAALGISEKNNPNNPDDYPDFAEFIKLGQLENEWNLALPTEYASHYPVPEPQEHEAAPSPPTKMGCVCSCELCM